MIKRILALFSSLILLFSCESDPLMIDVDDIEQETKFKRFDLAFFETDTSDFVKELKALDQEFHPFFLGGNTLGNWQIQRHDEKQQILYRRAKKVFGDMEEINSDLNYAMKHYYYYYPQTEAVEFYTYISNLDFNFPVLFADSLCFVAVDLYLGHEAEFYQSLPRYLAYYRQPKFMVRDCMEALAQNHVFTAKGDQTLLEQMIYYGKQLYFIEAMMPSLSKEIIIKYQPVQLQFCQSNERNIWAYFVENNVLFSAKTDLQKRFIDPAPFSKFGMRFDNETPGRIGQWIGWQIVRNYAEQHPEADLTEIMAIKDARKLLKLSAYKPE